MRIEAWRREGMLWKMNHPRTHTVSPYVYWILALFWACGATRSLASPVDDIPIPSDALDVHRQSYMDSKSRELSYRLDRPYPQSAPSAEHLKVLTAGGWAKCSGGHVGWDSYVDASRGSEHERTVFQNVTYWSKGDALLMIASFYYEKVGQAGRPARVPGNSDEFVVITEDHNPEVKKKLKLTCPDQ